MMMDCRNHLMKVYKTFGYSKRLAGQNQIKIDLVQTAGGNKELRNKKFSNLEISAQLLPVASYPNH